MLCHGGRVLALPVRRLPHPVLTPSSLFPPCTLPKNFASSDSSTCSPSTRAALSSAPDSPASGSKEGVRFQYEPVSQRLSFRTWHQRRQQRAPTCTRPEVDVMVEGQPLGGLLSSADMDALCQQIKEATALVLPKALLAKSQTRPDYKLPRVGAVSVVLCDDAHITSLNATHRGKAVPTDVLSFELDDDLDYKMHLPIKLLGDLVVSLDTAQRQAKDRGYDLIDELRVLLVHGMLHLCGLDHERSHQDMMIMAAAEQAVLGQLGWKGQGLIDAVNGSEVDDSLAEQEAEGQGSSRFDQALRERAETSPGASSSSLLASMPRAAPQKRPASGSLGVLGNVFGSSSEGVRADGGDQTKSKRGERGIAKGEGSETNREVKGIKEDEGSEGGDRATGRNMQSGSRSSGRAQAGERGVGKGLKPGMGKGGSQDNGSKRHASSSIAHFENSSSSRGSRTKSDSSVSNSLDSSSARTSFIKGTSSSSLGSLSGKSGAPSTSQFVAPNLARSSQPGPVHGRKGRSTVITQSSARQSVAVSPMQLTRDELVEPIRLVALDMDGTLLDNSSRIHPAAAAAIRAACAAGVRVMLATGKARPAAIRAAEMAGLAGERLLVSTKSPGIFLQGLAVHDSQGQQLSSAFLPPAVVADAFKYLNSLELSSGCSVVAFLGDECATLRMTDDLQTLHHVYHEPLANVLPSLDALLAGPPVRKLLFMSTPQDVTNRLTPYWTRALQGQQAVPLQAVPSMLEIVPEGVDKWSGMQELLDHFQLPRSCLMAVGDGMNDLSLIANAGVGVAVGNAVPDVKRAAAYRAARSNHDGGVAEAFERFVL